MIIGDTGCRIIAFNYPIDKYSEKLRTEGYFKSEYRSIDYHQGILRWSWNITADKLSVVFIYKQPTISITRYDYTDRIVNISTDSLHMKVIRYYDDEKYRKVISNFILLLERKLTDIKNKTRELINFHSYDILSADMSWVPFKLNSFDFTFKGEIYRDINLTINTIETKDKIYVANSARFIKDTMYCGEYNSNNLELLSFDVSKDDLFSLDYTDDRGNKI